MRTCVDRLAGEGGRTIAAAMRSPDGRGTYRLALHTREGHPSEALVDLRYRRLRVLPPIGKQKRYSELTLTVIHAMEVGKPEGREPVNWKLLTDLSVANLAQAVEKLSWYARRWKVGVFHKVLKSGCKAEACLLGTSERVVRLVAVLCVVAWRVFSLSMAGRADPHAAPALVPTGQEYRLLDHLVKAKPVRGAEENILSAYLTKVARLGGYLTRTKAPLPGHTVLWRILGRLMNTQMGVALGRGTCG